MLWCVIGAVVLVLAVGLLLLLRGRRRSQRTPVGGAAVAGYPMPGPALMPGQGSVLGAPPAGTSSDVFAASRPAEQAAPPTPIQQASGAISVGATTSTTAMKYCPACGAAHDPEDHFCPECGKPVT